MNESTSEHFLYKDGRALYSILDNKKLDGGKFKNHPYINLLQRLGVLTRIDLYIRIFIILIIMVRIILLIIWFG